MRFQVDSLVYVIEGCRARGIKKGDIAKIAKIEVGEKNWTYITLHHLRTDKKIIWNLRSYKHLDHFMVRVHDGNPLHSIVFALRFR